MTRFREMEPKIIKEEIPDNKEGNVQSPSPASDQSTTSRRPKGIKSPESPEEGPPNVNHSTTPPSLSHVTSTLHSTPPPSSTLVLSPNNSNAGSASPPATSGANRPNLGKLKRFLSTLVQFGAEINAELGEKVRTLVFNMVNGNITIEEFHASLQEATNFPLRPFVLPFLRTHLPLLQRELSYQARIAKQSTSQYLRHHEQLVLDPSFSPSEPSEIFNSEQTTENGKRKHSESIYENGITTSKEDPASSSEPQQKRERLQHSQPIPLLFNSTLNPLPTFQTFPTTGSHNFQFSGFNSHGSHQYASGFNTGLLGSNFHILNSVSHAAPPHLLAGGEYAGHQDAPAPRGKDDRSGDEEWKNINTMLNCILSMVEKTKRALSILQTRDRGTTTESDMKRAANEIIRITEDRIAEIKRRAEEAVNEVKRQAMVELERIVLKNSKSKEESEDANPESQPGSQNLCWNCGRKAQETCSGCNIARYCGSYCQHRDWETHHQVCCSTERRHLLGSSSRHPSEDRSRHFFDDRRNVLDERRNFLEEQHSRRHSSEENRRHEERKEESKRSDKEKDKTEVEKRNENYIDKASDKSNEGARKYSDMERINETNRTRLLPNISSQVLNIDSIRRIKNHVLNRDGEEKSFPENPLKNNNSLSNFTSATSLRTNRSNSRSTTPVSATSSVNDAQLTK